MLVVGRATWKESEVVLFAQTFNETAKPKNKQMLNNENIDVDPMSTQLFKIHSSADSSLISNPLISSLSPLRHGEGVAASSGPDQGCHEEGETPGGQSLGWRQEESRTDWEDAGTRRGKLQPRQQHHEGAGTGSTDFSKGMSQVFALRGWCPDWTLSTNIGRTAMKFCPDIKCTLEEGP